VENSSDLKMLKHAIPISEHDEAISSQAATEAMPESVRSLDFDELHLHTTVFTHHSAFTSQLNKQ
jgi:hypothetical protein